MTTENPHLGSSFDEFLVEDGLVDSSREVATKRVLAWQLTQLMEEKSLSKTDMAKRMGTSRSALNRLLDPENESVTYSTLKKAAHATDQRIELNLVPA